MHWRLPPYGWTRDPATGRRIAALASPKQAAYHAARAPFKLLCGGVGSGKSHAGAREFMLSLLTNGPDQMYLVGAPTHAILEDATWKHVTTLLDEIAAANDRRLDVKRTVSPQRREITLHGGIHVRFISLNKPENYAGATISGFWIDEGALLPEGMAAWDMLLDRLRDSAAAHQFGLVTTTPRGPVGVVQHFLDQVAAGNPDYHVTHTTTWDNVYTGEAYKRRMMVGRSARQIRQQMHAQVLDFVGSIYAEEYHRQKSVHWPWQHAGRQSPEVQYHVAIDWGPTYPHALFIEHDWRNDYDVIFDEICDDNLGHEELVLEVIRRLERRWKLLPGDLAGVWCDYNPQVAVRYAYKHFKHGHGVRVRGKVVATTDHLRDGIDAVAWRLRDAEGKRRMYLSPEVSRSSAQRGIAKCLGLYRWAERTVQSAKVLDDRRPEKGLYDHGPDALRYYCWQRYAGDRYRLPATEEEITRRRKKSTLTPTVQ